MFLLLISFSFLNFDAGRPGRGSPPSWVRPLLPPGDLRMAPFPIFSGGGTSTSYVRGGPLEFPSLPPCVGGLYCEWLINLNFVLIFVSFFCCCTVSSASFLLFFPFLSSLSLSTFWAPSVSGTRFLLGGSQTSKPHSPWRSASWTSYTSRLY